MEVWRYGGMWPEVEYPHMSPPLRVTCFHLGIRPQMCSVLLWGGMLRYVPLINGDIFFMIIII